MNEAFQTRPRISVALGAYRGTRYLPAQLESIAAQSRLADEVLVSDDASGDDTPDCAREAMDRLGLAGEVHVQPENLRSTRNFAWTIAECRGELIVLADQDDVWKRHKLARLAEALEANPDAAFAFSDAEMVDESLRPLGYRLWEAVRFDPRRLGDRRDSVAGGGAYVGDAFDLLLRRFVVTGATMAFRAEYRDLVLPIPTEWVHDAWIALLLSAVAPCAAIGEPLIEYRQHAAQQIGERKRGLLGQYQVARTLGTQYVEKLELMFRQARERLGAAHAGGAYRIEQARLDALSAKIEHLGRRLAWRRGARLSRAPGVLAEWLLQRYSRYSLGWKSVAHDLFL